MDEKTTPRITSSACMVRDDNFKNYITSQHWEKMTPKSTLLVYAREKTIPSESLPAGVNTLSLN